MKQVSLGTLVLLFVGTCGIAHAQAAGDQPDPSAELEQLFKEDQADRMEQPIDWEAVSQRDEARRARVLELLKAGQVETAQDHYHAAMVFQHGMDSADYERARDLALEAVRLDSTFGAAKWLSAAAQDRYLHSVGKPQWYGTQFQMPAEADRWTIEPIDTAAVTDAEREALGVPTLKETRKRLEEMNQELERERSQKQE